MMPTMPGAIQSVTVATKAISVLRSATENAPSCDRSASTYSSTPSSLRSSGLLRSSMTATSATNISAQIGAAMIIQSRNEIFSPVASSIRPRPIRFGGDPTGVSSPPTLAPYASISIRAAPTRSRSGSKSSETTPWDCISLAITARMPMAVGSSIATVAVLETKADNMHVIAPKAMITRNVDLPTPGKLSTNIANRLARPCLSIAWARMKAPMNVKTVEEPNGASASSAEVTPSSTMAPIPMNPPTGIGTGSVIQRTTTPSRTAASVCCWSSMPSGSSSITMVTSGASTRPTVRRPFSNRSSPSESRCSPRLR